jgi:hypothetical protein
MEFLLVVVGLIGFTVLAIRYGHDSRDTFVSAEHMQAGLGLTWDGNPARMARYRPAVPQRRLRHHTAVALYRFADWVQPPTNDARRAA